MTVEIVALLPLDTAAATLTLVYPAIYVLGKFPVWSTTLAAGVPTVGFISLPAVRVKVPVIVVVPSVTVAWIVRLECVVSLAVVNQLFGHVIALDPVLNVPVASCVPDPLVLRRVYVQEIPLPLLTVRVTLLPVATLEGLILSVSVSVVTDWDDGV